MESEKNRLEIGNNSLLYDKMIKLLGKKSTLLMQIYELSQSEDDEVVQEKLENYLGELSKIESLLKTINNNFSFAKGENK